MGVAHQKKIEDLSKDKITDAVKKASVMRNLKNERLLEHLRLNAGSYVDYHAVREAVTTYFVAKRDWGQDGDGMAVDALTGKKLSLIHI